MAKKNIGLPRPQKRNVQLSKLTTDEDSFQPRLSGLTENHVANLQDVLKRGEDLDPIQVWKNPDTGSLVVADGHHRLEAYQRERTDSHKITVQVYECDRSTAMVIPVAENAKDRLQLRYDDRANRSWKLNVETGLSKANVASACGISARTVATQRQIMKQLTDEEQDLPDTWKEAQTLAQGHQKQDFTDEQREAAMEAAIKKADEKIGSTLAELYQRWPDAAFELNRRCAGETAFENALEYAGCVQVGDTETDISRIAQCLGEHLDEDQIDELAKQAKDVIIPF